MTRTTFTITVISIALMSLSACKKAKKKAVSSAVDNTEVVTTTEDNVIPGWHAYNKVTIGLAWQIEDGVLSFDKDRGEGGDIVSDEEYENFELSLEWKIQDCGNSGIFWNIVESKDYAYPWLTGPEMQVLDNKCHPDAKIDTHRAGDLYDMIETAVVNVKPAGEWNTIKIRSDNGAMTFWQNGAEVVKFTMHDAQWDAMVANSKFKDMSAFGKATKGRIGLQDHGDKVWFRNIDIKHI